MLARRQLRQAAQAALQAAKISASLDAPGDWVSQPQNLPGVLLRATRGNREPWTAGPASFTSTVVLELESRAVGNSGPAAQDAIDALDFAIEQALFTNMGFVELTQRIYVDTETEITAEGRNHFGATKWAIRCEFVETFDPIYDAPAALQPVAPPLAGIDVQVDLVGTFDPNGTYPPGTFANQVMPAPRTAGPDGRDEGGLTINLPQ